MRQTLRPPLVAFVPAAALAAVTALTVLAALPAPLATQAPRPAEPFAFADFGWLNGTPRTSTPVIDSRLFTGELRFDGTYIRHAARPRDHTLVGSSESGRTGEFQLQQLGIGGDLHHGRVRGRVMTQFGMYSKMTPRNDASPARGQWGMDDAYRYLSEAYAGYRFGGGRGVNVDAGLFMSYIGLFSYYNFDNWAYQPSYVSSNTPWFFNGVRIQTFPTDRLKLEYWVVNGWQSYGTFNEAPGLGMQVLWRPTAAVSLLSNNYWGHDTPGNAERQRIHTDNSIQVRYREDSTSAWSRGAVSLTVDAGCESGGGVRCGGDDAAAPAQHFLGAMLYHRAWFARNRWAFTLGTGGITNPGRYLVLVPPINGATAASGTPYFTAAPGDDYRAWDASATVDFMPDAWTTVRMEVIHRAANVPYFSGRGGVTPPGGNVGAPGSLVTGWSPDLRKQETRAMVAFLLRL